MDSPKGRDPDRARIELTLTGAPFPNGEIPLGRMADIAGRTQALIHRLARTLTERRGRGRSPDYLAKATELSLTGIREGSTVLEIAGPMLQAELDLGDLPADVGTQALSIFIEGVDAAAEGGALPDAYDEATAKELADWFEPLEDSQELRISAHVGSRTYDRAVVPRAVREMLTAPSVGPPSDAAARRTTVEGTLYLVNLHTGRFGIDDDAGNSISVVITLPADQARTLIGRRVVVSGLGELDANGHLTVTAESLEPTAGVEGLDARAFFQTTGLDDLLAGASPLTSMDSLALDLSDEEADAFLATLTSDE